MCSLKRYVCSRIVVKVFLLMIGSLPLCAVSADALEIMITGTVYEKGTRKPMAGANVYVIEQDEINTVTNQHGEFSLTIGEPGVYPLQAVAFGFDKSIPLVVRIPDLHAELAPVKLYLIPLAILPEIVVQAERNEDKVGRTIVTGSELEQVAGGGRDPLRAIETLPGIVSGGEGPAIRGSGPGDNAFYVDDIPVEYLFHAGGLVSVLPVDVIDDFNLYTAAFGPQYGDVLGGVIDVGLRDPRSDRLGGLIDVSILSTQFLLEGPVSDNQTFWLSARRSYLDLIVKEINDEEEDVRFSLPQYSDYLGRYLWDINSNNRLSLYLMGASDDIEFTIGKNADTGKKEPALVGDSNVDTSYHNQTITWDSLLAKDVNNRLLFGHNLTHERNNIGTAFSTNIKFNSYYIREKLNLRPHPKHKLLLGTDIQRWLIDLNANALVQNCSDLQQCGPISSGERKQLQTTLDVYSAALFIKDRWNFLPRFTLVSGLRYSYENYLDRNYLEPRFGIEWQQTKNTLFTAGWGIYNQFPGGIQVLEDIGNPQLEHLRANHSVLGVTHDLNKDWRIKSEVYYKNFENLVIGVDDERNYINSADGRAYGWELFIKKNRTDNLWGWLSFTLSRSERTNELGKTFVYDYDQPIISTLVTNYEFARFWTFGINWQYHTGAPYDPIIGGVLVTDSQGNPVDPPFYAPIYDPAGKNSGRLPPYHRLDVRIDRDWFFDSWKLKAYFEVLNIYNRCNVVGYDYNERYSPESREDVCGIPLIPSFGVSAEF